MNKFLAGGVYLILYFPKKPRVFFWHKMKQQKYEYKKKKYISQDKKVTTICKKALRDPVI